MMLSRVTSKKIWKLIHEQFEMVHFEFLLCLAKMIKGYFFQDAKLNHVAKKGEFNEISIVATALLLLVDGHRWNRLGMGLL